MGKKSMSGRKLTFLLITIPIVALFFCFNTLPLIKGVNSTALQTLKAMEAMTG